MRGDANQTKNSSGQDSGSCPDAVLEKLARDVVSRRLETAAVVFLEMHLPLTNLLYSSTLLFQPLLSPFVGNGRIEALSSILADRRNIEWLIRRIEELSEKRRESVH
jgi:hypothetical protein